MSHVITQKIGKVGYVTMNRPEKGNALSNSFTLKLTKAIVEFNHDKDIVIIVIKSSGDVFCEGADQTYMEELMHYSYPENIKDSFDLMKLYKAIYLSPKITIAQVEGNAVSGGAGIAINTDFCFSTPTARFGFVETKTGFIPGIVLNFLRLKIGTAQLKKLLFTSQLIPAEKAQTIGMITEVVDDNMTAFIDSFTNSLLKSNSHDSLLTTKEVLIKSESMTLEDALSYSATMNASSRETKDSKKGIEAFLMNEKVKWC